MKIKQGRLFPFVTPYSRNAFLIESETRKEETYLVDFEGDENEEKFCTCEAFILGKQRPCKHITILESYLIKT